MIAIQAVGPSKTGPIYKIDPIEKNAPIKNLDNIRLPKLRDTIKKTEIKAETDFYPPSKPNLLAPAQYSSLDTLNEVYSQNKQISEVEQKRLFEKYEKASLQKKQQLDETHKKIDKMQMWNSLKDVSTCFMDLFYIYAGTACITAGAGTTMGTTMALSGSMDLANKTMYYTGGWQYAASFFQSAKNAQTHTADTLYKGFQITSWVLGLASARVDQFMHQLPWTDTLTKAGLATFQFIGASMTLAQNFDQAHLKQYEGQIKQLEGKQRELLFQREDQLDFKRDDLDAQKQSAAIAAEQLQTRNKTLENIINQNRGVLRG